VCPAKDINLKTQTPTFETDPKSKTRYLLSYHPNHCRVNSKQQRIGETPPYKK
jgi:hypothetical protein